jgi:aminopeptidase N
VTSLIRQLLSPVTADDYLPGHGDLSFDVTRYDLTLDYKLVGNRLTGKARIDAVACEDLTDFTLDLESLRTTKVRITGVGVAKHTSHRGKLVVTPKATIAAGQRFSVHVSYGGNPRPYRSKGGEAGWEELTDGVIVAGQPGGAPSWFPCNDRPSSKATYRISVTAPSDYHVVANGRLKRRHRRAGATTWVYEENAPMATYLATVQIGRYRDVSLADSPVPQRAVVPRALATRLPGAFVRQREMLGVFTRIFGPYPFDDYTVVVTEDELEIPLEAQGLAIFGSDFLDPKQDDTRLVAHELAHQWFGNSLTLRDWRDIWLHEGFACYAEWLWAEESGQGSAHDLAVDHLARLARAPQDLVIGDPGPDLMFDDRVYKRGALTLHAVRLTVGDEAFFATLRGWVQTHAHDTVTTDQLIEFMSQRTGHDLTGLFHSWLLEEALPALPRRGRPHRRNRADPPD